MSLWHTAQYDNAFNNAYTTSGAFPKGQSAKRPDTLSVRRQHGPDGFQLRAVRSGSRRSSLDYAHSLVVTGVSNMARRTPYGAVSSPVSSQIAHE